MNLALTVLIGFHMIRTRGGFQTVFADFDTALPPLTTVAISVWFAWLLPVLGAISLCKELLFRNDRLRLVLNFVHLGLILTAREFYIQGTLAPLYHLIQSVQ